MLEKSQQLYLQVQISAYLNTLCWLELCILRVSAQGWVLSSKRKSVHGDDNTSLRFLFLLAPWYWCRLWDIVDLWLRHLKSKEWNRIVSVSAMFSTSVPQYLGNSYRKRITKRMLSWSFNAKFSFSFSEIAEDERSMMRWEAPHSLFLLSISNRECMPAERASVITRTATLSFGRWYAWKVPSGRRSITSVCSFGVWLWAGGEGLLRWWANEERIRE